jgi:glycosyltransferase involved in cell wall biosynthesis
MNVIFLLPAFPENPRTGGEVYNRYLIEGLRARGHDVEILLLPNINRQPLMAGSRAIYNLLTNYRGNARVVLYDTWLYRWLWPIMGLLRFRTNFRFISFAQLCYWDTYSSFASRTFHRMLTWAALLPAHQHVAVSKTMLLDDLGVLSRICAGEVIYPGCDWAETQLPEADTGRRPAQIISVANYGDRKGFHVLVEALSLVVKRAPDLGGSLTLRLLGNLEFDPAYVERLKSMIAAMGLSDRVILDGWKSRDELSRLLGESQLFAFASTSEGFGMVVAEAMLHGLPVLLSDFKVAPELLDGSPGAGYIVAKGDSAGFAQAICDYFTNRDRARMGTCAQARAKQLVSSWDHVVERFERTIIENDARASGRRVFDKRSG